MLTQRTTFKQQFENVRAQKIIEFHSANENIYETTKGHIKIPTSSRSPIGVTDANDTRKNKYMKTVETCRGCTYP